MTTGNNVYIFKRLGMNDIEVIKSLFISVFTAPPWYDDWSDEDQLNHYLEDLCGQSYSLTYGLFENGELIGVSMGYIKHWFSGTEYYIDELCIRGDQQGKGVGTYFMNRIEDAIKELGLVRIFLQTEKEAPAYHFYQKNGFTELEGHVSFTKNL